MSRLKWAIIGCVLMAGSAASAETGKPRNVLEFLFGRKADQPAAISPAPAQATIGAKAAVNAAKKQAKGQDAEPRRSIRKSKGESETRSASAGGAFRGGGNNAYCVRTCDGFFFPINFEGAQGGDRYESACQQSCPGAETQVYFMKRGGDIRWASTARGTSYSSLENALKYRKERDPACSCKAQGQSWSSILAPVEARMKQNKSDLVVTEEISQRIAKGEDASALAKAHEQTASRQAAGSPKQAAAGDANDAYEVMATSTMRSSFGDQIAPANKFTKIDPDRTGSLSTKPAATNVPAAKVLQPKAPEAKAGKPAPAKPSNAEKKAAAPWAAPETTAKAEGKPQKALVKAEPLAPQPEPAKTAEAKKADAKKAEAKKAEAKKADVKKAERAKAAAKHEKPESKPAKADAAKDKTVLAAARKATAKAQDTHPDKMALRQALDRLIATDKR